MPTINPYTVNDPVVNMLRQQIEEASLHPEPERAPFTLRRTTRFLWRSKPGTLRKIKVKIPGIPASIATIDEFQGIKTIKDYGAKFQKIYDRKHTPDLREMFDAAREANGGQDYITFTELSQTFECYFETDSPEIATFMRWYLDSHPKVGQYVYEDLGIQMLKSRYTDKEFPNTEAGRQQLFAFDRAFEKALNDHIATQQAEVLNSFTGGPPSTGDYDPKTGVGVGPGGVLTHDLVYRGEGHAEWPPTDDTAPGTVVLHPEDERSAVLENVPVPPVDVTEPIAEAVTPTPGSQKPRKG